MSFKKPTRSFRQRKQSSSSESSEEEEAVSSVLEETKELQKLRRRQRGVNAEDLAAGKILKKEIKTNAEISKLKTGGYIDLKTLKKELAQAESVDEIEQIGTTFAAATNARDEDAEMLKYVEEELSKRKGIIEDEEEEMKNAATKNALDKLYDLPEHLKAITSKNKKSEDMLSNQMLSGIPELDLGIEMKIKNIEATEEAKQKLLDERLKKKNDVSNFVPTNVAVNFVQHNRFRVDDHKPAPKRPAPAPAPAPLRVGDTDRPSTLQDLEPKRAPGEKATDDFHYERFKKQLRRF